ncbi:MAG: transcription elongation factor GreA [Acidobacteriota bacterium]
MAELPLKKLKDEVRELDRELNLVLPKELKKARAHGDLSENAEYSAAKERQRYVSARLGQLRKRLADLSLVNVANIPRDRVGFGSTVKLYDLEREAETTYKLVMSEESDFAKGLISTSSPIGRALMGKEAGDSVKVATPSGPREFEILEFRTMHEDA